MVQPSLYDVSPLLRSSNFLNPLRQHQCEPAPAEGEIHGHRCFISTSSLMKFSSSVTHTGSTSSSYTTAGVHVQTRLRDHMKIHSKKKRIKVAPVVAHVHAAIPKRSEVCAARTKRQMPINFTSASNHSSFLPSTSSMTEKTQ